MRSWYFSEMAYHLAWEKGLARGSLRVNFPSENIDPETAGKLLNRYLDEFALCDEVDEYEDDLDGQNAKDDRRADKSRAAAVASRGVEHVPPPALQSTFGSTTAWTRSMPQYLTTPKAGPTPSHLAQ